MEEVRGVTIDTGTVLKPVKVLKQYGSKLSVYGIHDVRIFTDNSHDEILSTESTDKVEISDRELNYLKGYLSFTHTIYRTTKRTLPPTKNEAQGHDYKFCGEDKAAYKPVQSLLKKGILKEVMWRVGDKNNKNGSLRSFIALTPFGRKFIDEKVLGPQGKETNTSAGDIPENGESVSSDSV